MQLRRRYFPGDTVRMIINNITEPVSSVEWHIDGSLINSDIYVFRQEGTYRMEVTLKYSSDGSTETISRTVTVSEAINEKEDDQNR